MRLIDADELEYRKCSFKGGVIEDILYKKDIKRAATVDAQPVIHAKWEQVKYPDYMICYFKCSKCGKTGAAVRFKYCPNCGAKMDGEK